MLRAAPDREGEDSILLKESKICCDLTNLVADVQVRQYFYHRSDPSAESGSVVEVSYKFQLPKNAALYHFEGSFYFFLYILSSNENE